MSGLARARRLLEWPWLPPVTILLALLLVSPSLKTGWMMDDYFLLARLDPRVRVAGLEHAPFDLFSFVAGPEQRAALMEAGLWGWWTAPDFRASFWRPLSSLTHLLDYLVRPRSALVAHAQSMLWFAALLGVLAVLYRRFHVPWVAHLALLLYAVDDAHGVVVAWVANRNALVAATLAFAALLAHDRSRRDGWRPGAWLAPALFAAALVGGEAALSVTAYLLAHALFIDRDSLVRRLTRLWPYAAVSVLWLAVYKALGYGTNGGGLYIDPAADMARYLGALVERLPILLAAQLGFVPADVWMYLPKAGKVAVFGLALATVAAAACVLAPILRRQPVCRFWALGALLSLPPVCAAVPMNRLLLFTGAGAMAAIAMLMAEALQRDAAMAFRGFARIARRFVLPLLVLAHLVVAPPSLLALALSLTVGSRMLERGEASIPQSEGIQERTLVIVNAPVDLLAAYEQARRAVLGVPRPRRLRLLATGFSAVHVSRLDARTLRVRPADGFLRHEVERTARGPSRPFHVGDEIVLSDLRVRVSEVTADGRPRQADFTFNVALEDPSFLWMRSGADTWAAYSPPAVGTSHLLPSSVPEMAAGGS